MHSEDVPGDRLDVAVKTRIWASRSATLMDLAAFYAAPPPRPRPILARVAASGRLAEQHHCTSCRGPGLTGQQQAARLAGQDLDDRLRLLLGFKAKTASDLDGTMTVATQPLSDDEIVSLAHFLTSLGPQTEH